MSEKKRSGRKGNGRWRGGNNNNNNNGKKNSKNKPTNSNRNTTQKVEFAPYSSNQKGAYAVYDTVLKAVISKVSAECNKCTEDIVESLEDDKYIDLDNKRPRKKVSTFYSDGWTVGGDGYVIDGLGAAVTDFEDNPVTTDSYFYKREKAHANRNREAVEEDDEYIHRERLKTWIQRVDSFETNKRKAYDIILKFCSGEMKERLDNHPNKDSFRGDPIATLQAIRMVIHDPIKARYEYASLTDALFRLMTIKQHENENLSVFTKRYRAAAELVESHLGKDLLNQFVKRTDDYKQASDTERLLVEAGALEQWFAYHYTTRVDQSKYGGWCRHQELNQGNVGTNGVRSTYPKTIQAAYDALRLYKWDKTPKKGDNKPKTPKSEEKEKPSEETKVEASFSTQEGKFKKKCKDNNLCFICGDQHPFNNCSLADKIARIHWYVNSGRRHQTGTNHQHLHHQMEGVPDDYSIPSQVSSQAPMVPTHHTMFQGYHYPTIAQLPPGPTSQYAYQQQARPTTPSVASLPPNQPPPKQQAEIFHKFVAKALFVCKRARLDIQTAVAVLCTRTKEPTTHEWNGLLHLMKYLTATVNLTRKIDTRMILSVLKWWIDASFAVHPDFKSHTGGVSTGVSDEGGAITALSRKQKLNTRSSTEAELVGADDMMTMVLWVALFMEAQGYRIERNIIMQDNKSAILLEVNGRSSAGQRSRAINIRYFFITDQVARGNAVIQYCPTDLMIGDFLTKPLQGSKFTTFRDALMNSDFDPERAPVTPGNLDPGPADPADPQVWGLAQMALAERRVMTFHRA